jgi:hypothetical protein
MGLREDKPHKTFYVPRYIRYFVLIQRTNQRTVKSTTVAFGVRPKVLDIYHHIALSTYLGNLGLEELKTPGLYRPCVTVLCI